MKKGNAERLKRIIAVLTIITALGLPAAAQDKSGYTLGSGRTGDTTTTQSADDRSGVFMGSGTRTIDASTTQTTGDALLAATVWSWMSSLIRQAE
jgi:hypothetical protein